MKRSIVLIASLVFFLVYAGNAISAQRALDDPGKMLIKNKPQQHELGFVPGELLVKYKPRVASSSIQAFQVQQGIKSIKKFKHIKVHHVNLPKDMNVKEALEIYRNNPEVEYAEPNYYRYAAATIPDDTDFEELWGLNNTGQEVNGTSGTVDADIDAPEAWDITTGSSDIVIAVIDSGVAYNHPDLQNNIWENTDETSNGDDADGNGYDDDVRGWDFVDDDNDPVDSDGHGTHVAGTIAAIGDNGTGIAGVCWSAKIMPLRILNAAGNGTVTDEVSAINYAVENGANIINASISAPGFSQTEKDAIAEAGSAGILFVAAAGNRGDDNRGDGWNNDVSGQEIYPASYDLANIISVAATDQDDNLCTFSNYGEISVDVTAPGQNIYSTKPARQTVWSDNFDDGDINDWETGGTNNTWGLSDTISLSPQYSLTDSPGNPYQNYTDSWAQARVLDFSSHSGTKLEFALTGHSESNFDFFYGKVSVDESNWSDFLKISGDFSDYWYLLPVDLGAYDGENQFYIRFAFTSDYSITYDGWYVDDVTVTASSSSYSNTDYQYLPGTSMATPHVAGLAGLIWGRNPTLTMTDIKDTILNNVERLDSLSGKVATGGRINALNALFPPPRGLFATTVSNSQIDISWTDNSSDESGFKIERKIGAGGTYTQIATVSEDITSYTDTELAESTTYYYRVRAYNSNVDSNYSNIANATTSGASGDDEDDGNGGGGGGGCFISTVLK